ncbi:EF-hand domain-containing protein [Chitinibacteraceae bacterium HSL-7]
MTRMFVPVVIALTATTLWAADATPKAPVTRADFIARATQHFDAMDTDRNGTVTQTERAAFMRKMQAERGPMTRDAHQTQAKAMFERKDANHDGKLSGDETRGQREITEAQFLARAQQRFDAMDANKDGTVTPDERGSKMQDKKAKLPDMTREQFVARAGQRFDRMDKNGNGVLDAGEGGRGMHGFDRTGTKGV